MSIPEMTPEQAAWQANNQRRRAQAFQEIADRMGIWQLCPRKPCHRGQGCRGDARQCLHAFFSTMPDDMRDFTRATIQARLAGASPQQAVAQARQRFVALGMTPPL